MRVGIRVRVRVYVRIRVRVGVKLGVKVGVRVCVRSGVRAGVGIGARVLINGWVIVWVGDSYVGDIIMLVTFGDFFRYVADFPSVLNRSLTS